MTSLHLDHFMRASEDYEGAQYRVLSGLQRVRQAFSRNVIYPYLRELIQLYEALNTVVQRLARVRDAMPGSLTGVDLEAGTLVFEKPELGPDHMAYVEELIRWALPRLRDAIDEGKTVYEFVEDNLCMEEVGIVPSYVQEGYLMVPDGRQRQTHILQYTLSVFTRSDERFRSLKTTYVKSLPRSGIVRSPNSIKMELVSEFRSMPNPATYFFSASPCRPLRASVSAGHNASSTRYATPPWIVR